METGSTKVKPNYKKLLYYTAVIILSSAVRALAIHIFILGNNFAPGGVTGIATMIEYGTGISSGYFIVALNAPLLLIALKYINKPFVIKTASTTLLSALFLIVLKNLDIYMYTEDKIVAALACGCMIGTSLFLMLRIGGSTGGTDIIAYIIQKRNQATNVAWYIFILDTMVIAASFFVYDYKLTPVFLAIIELFVSSKVTETISRGFQSAIKFEIICDNPDELIDAILKKVRCGITKIDAVGGYTKVEKGVLFCVVHKRQVTALRQVLKEYSGVTFSYVSSASEVLGKGFSS